jgi:DNA-binding response OmpR family regulator
MHRILVVGASTSMVDVLDRAARGLECQFIFTEPIRAAVAACLQSRPDFAIIDNTSSDLDAFEMFETLRQPYGDLLVMLLSPEGTKLAQGAQFNMHLIQPISVRKLGNRFKKLIDIRRTQPITVGEFTLDPEKRRISHLGRVVRLTPKEYRLLEFLMHHAGSVLTRRQIMKEVWETDYLGDTRTLDVHVRWLREKLEPDTRSPIHLRTIRRVGYVFDSGGAGKSESEGDT